MLSAIRLFYLGRSATVIAPRAEEATRIALLSAATKLQKLFVHGSISNHRILSLSETTRLLFPHHTALCSHDVL